MCVFLFFFGPTLSQLVCADFCPQVVNPTSSLLSGRKVEALKFVLISYFLILFIYLVVFRRYLGCSKNVNLK